MSSASEYTPICATCNDGKIGMGYSHTQHPTPADLQANIPRCLICAAIWHGIKLFPGGEEMLADPRPMHLRLGLWQGSMFRVRYGRSTKDWHLDPSFSLIKKEGSVVGDVLGLKAIPKMPAIDPQPFAPSTLSEIKKQIRECKRRHKHSRARKKYVPDRLVDLGPASNQLDAVLLDDTSGVRAPYIALSHCWGGTIPYRTLRSNKEELCRCIDYFELSENFQDAFTVARRLSYRYIWIDSFCIIQDDKQDWLQQATKMADVYSGAELTISAARSPSFDDGFLGHRETDIELPFSDRLPPGTKVYVRDGDALESVHQGINRQPSYHAPLFQRAWAFQERLLSQRIIHFLKTEIVFECEESLWCECGEKDSYEDSNYDKEVYRSSTWEELVEQYVSRNLTYPMDTLPAISAIARDYGMKGGYIAGLTHEAFFSNLLWQVKAPRDLSGELTTVPPPRRPDEYIAPSFSWASIIARVEWVKGQSSYQSVCTLEDFATTLENPDDPYGRVLSGHITLRGPAMDVKMRYTPRIYQGQLTGRFHPVADASEPKRDIWAVLDILDDPRPGEELKLITVHEETNWYFRNNGLVLRPSKRGQGYERVGCFWDTSKSFMKLATIQSVTIF
ncbi:heterokaryon incompatibility protein-domain-containing protein [Nemania sp. FL0916]|nr:heterokaryon incompatibility protein-domain-containing protein [Nemania sp. FL0916]